MSLLRAQLRATCSYTNLSEIADDAPVCSSTRDAAVSASVRDAKSVIQKLSLCTSCQDVLVHGLSAIVSLTKAYFGVFLYKQEISLQACSVSARGTVSCYEAARLELNDFTRSEKNSYFSLIDLKLSSYDDSTQELFVPILVSNQVVAGCYLKGVPGSCGIGVNELSLNCILSNMALEMNSLGKTAKSSCVYVEGIAPGLSKGDARSVLPVIEVQPPPLKGNCFFPLIIPPGSDNALDSDGGDKVPKIGTKPKSFSYPLPTIGGSAFFSKSCVHASRSLPCMEDKQPISPNPKHTGKNLGIR